MVCKKLRIVVLINWELNTTLELVLKILDSIVILNLIVALGIFDNILMKVSKIT
jgi:hypothetical protein